MPGGRHQAVADAVRHCRPVRSPAAPHSLLQTSLPGTPTRPGVQFGRNIMTCQGLRLIAPRSAACRRREASRSKHAARPIACMTASRPAGCHTTRHGAGSHASRLPPTTCGAATRKPTRWQADCHVALMRQSPPPGRRSTSSARGDSSNARNAGNQRSNVGRDAVLDQRQRPLVYSALMLSMMSDSAAPRVCSSRVLLSKVRHHTNGPSLAAESSHPRPAPSSAPRSQRIVMSQRERVCRRVAPSIWATPATADVPLRCIPSTRITSDRYRTYG